MRRLAAAVLASAALAVPPAHAATTASIVLTLGYTVTCDGAVAPGSCTATLSGAGCIETLYAPPCTVDPMTLVLRPVSGQADCALAGGWVSDPGAEVVLHTLYTGELTVPVTMVVSSRAVAMYGVVDNIQHTATLTGGGFYILDPCSFAESTVAVAGLVTFDAP